MHYGVYLPNFGKETDARALADLACRAEDAGWDGFFIWDHMLYSKSQKLPMVDPWVALAAVAVKTERIRFGTTVTPLARRRPWKLARETVTLDHLSGGRLTLSVGLGHPPDAEFEYFGESGNDKTRAAKLDEGLDILTGLWRGKSFSYNGKYYQLKKMTFTPAALQTPRIPIWVGGFWPNKAPFRRAARWDGVLPLFNIKATPDALRELVAYVKGHRTSSAPFDVVLIGSRNKATVGGAKGAKKIELYAEAGMTWWLESLYMERNSVQDMKASIRLGPPVK